MALYAHRKERSMNLKYLGDALDHWKGSLFARLIADGNLVDLGVYPMLTDYDDWTENDFDLCAQLLRIPSAAVQRARLPLRPQNRNLGASIHKGDAFLDPDTGVATSRVNVPEQYVFVQDVMSLLFNGMNRVVAVYQHVRAKRVAERVDQVIRVFPSMTHWASYESGTVAMLFVSLAPRRTEKIAESLAATLGRHAGSRVRSGST